MASPWNRLARGPVRIHTRNDVYQRMEAVKRNRRKRAEYGECFVESVAAVDSALRNGWEVRALLSAAGSSLSRWALDVERRCPAATLLRLEPELMAELSDREETSELLAVVATRRIPLDAIPRGVPLAALVLDRPASPGNLGSILRSCDAFRADGVAVRGHAADLYDPQTIRSSLGAVFSVPVAVDASNEELAAWLASLRRDLGGLQVLGTSPDASLRIWEADLGRPTVFLLGNERRGMSEWLRESADRTVSIPGAGTVDSLNLAAAATIVLYELRRQRDLAACAGAPSSPPSSSSSLQ